MTDSNVPMFANRRLRVCIWNPTPAMLSAEMHQFEAEFKRLGSLEMINLKSLDDPSFLPCDLLVIAARNIDEEHFIPWLQGIESRIQKSSGIRTPAIIQAKIPADKQRRILRWAVESNWYFDIVDADHISSLPIRVANFLRLHDHLQEVGRMQKIVNDLTDRAENLESELTRLLNKLGDSK